MATASVGIIFEVKDKADAQSKIAAWTLHEGCRVSLAVSEIIPSGETDAKGKFKETPIPEPVPEQPPVDASTLARTE
jgi:hypothetical protein